MENRINKENISNTPAHAWILDVDGVITHPEEKQVKHPEILDEIIKRLKKKEPVALNTGRSMSWLDERVLGALRERTEDSAILSNFMACAENGTVWRTFDANGNATDNIDEKASIPSSVIEKARKIVEEKFSDTMFFDESKKTMVSIEMKDGITVKEFREHQTELDQELQELIANTGIEQTHKIRASRIASDIFGKQVDKHFGTRKILEWLRKKGISPNQFIVIGDSKTDTEISDEIKNHGLNVRFVFVGKQEELDIPRPNYDITLTTAHCDDGTLSFLSSFT